MREVYFHECQSPSHSHYPMPELSTPPNSQHTAVISALSDTTPLKRDLPGTEAHTSTPTKRASERYLDMTFDICNKFVGAMPVNDFLEEFVTVAPSPRPQGEFSFDKPRVSQNENDFVSLPPLLTHALSTTLDCGHSGFWVMPRLTIQEYNHSPDPDIPQQTGHLSYIMPP